MALPPVGDSVGVVWSRISSILSKELSERSYKTWFEGISLHSYNDTSLVLSVPDQYYGKWLEDHYQNLILSAAQEVLGKAVSVTYHVIERPKTAASFPSHSPKDRVSGLVSLNSNYTFDNFVIGPGNRFAHAAALAVTDAPARQYNPLFIYGPTGLGKTHLLQSIAYEIGRRFSNYKILYISSEQLFQLHHLHAFRMFLSESRQVLRQVQRLLYEESDIHLALEKKYNL